MGARLRVFLSQEQDKALLKLRTTDVPQKVKDRAEQELEQLRAQLRSAGIEPEL